MTKNRGRKMSEQQLIKYVVQQVGIAYCIVTVHCNMCSDGSCFFIA